MAKTHHRGIAFGKRTVWFHVRRSRRIVMKNAEECSDLLYHGSHAAFGIGIIALFFFALKWAQSGYDNGHNVEPETIAVASSPEPICPRFKVGETYATEIGIATITESSSDGKIIYGRTGLNFRHAWDSRTGRLVGCDDFIIASKFSLKDRQGP